MKPSTAAQRVTAERYATAAGQATYRRWRNEIENLSPPTRATRRSAEETCGCAPGGAPGDASRYPRHVCPPNQAVSARPPRIEWPREESNLPARVRSLTAPKAPTR